MGILNVTPDSFADGGRYAEADAAVDRAAQMLREGAAIVDVGGESTRPGATEIAAAVEVERVVPVIERLASRFDAAISIDTSKLEVMAAAAAAGACIVNDVRALRAPGAREWAALARVGVCLMHMQGNPRMMQDDPRYGDVVAEVAAFLGEQRGSCLAAGIGADSIAVDPGIGFGKNLEHNLALLRELPALAALGSPVIVGVSRKSLISRVLGVPADQRLHGGIGLAALAVARGANIIRTHDVAPTLEAIRMVSAVIQGTQA